MDSIGMSCVKYLLFLFNLIFAVFGIIVVTIGLMIHQMYSNYSLFIGDKLFSAPVLFIAVGVFIFIVAFFGCCGAIKENNVMLVIFAILLCIIFILEVAGGVAAYIMKDGINSVLETRMNNSIKLYNSNVYYNKTWNAVQYDFSCCGVNSYTDWESVFPTNTLPYACCPNISTDEKCVPSLATKDGCLPALRKTFEHNIFIIIAAGAAVAIVQFIGVIFACCLSRSIRKYETV